MPIADVSVYFAVLATLSAMLSFAWRKPSLFALTTSKATLAVAFAGGVLTGTLASALVAQGSPALSSSQVMVGSASGDDAFGDLRSYVQTVSAGSSAPAPMSSMGSTGDLPDVETMISRLEARLASDPEDGQGWRMLGWSYANTGKAEKAVAAYTKAAELLPDAADVKEALATAKSQLEASSSAEATP